MRKFGTVKSAYLQYDTHERIHSTILRQMSKSLWSVVGAPNSCYRYRCKTRST